jgi:hypothetical protein
MRYFLLSALVLFAGTSRASDLLSADMTAVRTVMEQYVAA